MAVEPASPKGTKKKRSYAEAEIDRYLGEYVGILKAPRVLEALGVHAYAVQDLKPTVAAHLQELAAGLRSGSLSASGLVGALDEASVAELASALSGKVSLRRVSLAALVQRLAGRRLPAERILALVSEWLGKGREGELVAVEGAAGVAGPAAEQDPLDWWPLVSAGALSDPSLPAEAFGRRVRELAERLEERFPSAGLAASLRRLGSEALLLYICAEPFHTRAVQAAWRILAERALKGEGAPEGTASGPTAEAGRRRGPRSRHADPARAAEIEGHLELAARIARSLACGFPERLSVRLDLEALLSDPWTDADLQAATSVALAEVAALGERWLAGLPPVQSLDLEKAPLVLLIDAIAPDLWLAVKDLVEAYPQELATSWARLEAEAKTAAATAALLGLEADPVESLEARGILYLQRSGREAEQLADWLQPLPAGRAAVIRLGGLDRDAHQGSLKLAEMAAILRHLLERQLPDLLRFCRQQGRPLVLTTDHGLSLAFGHLSHGRGGVYERAIFRASWGL